MPEPIEREPRAAAVLAETLAVQAAALHVLFMRTVGDVLSNNERSLRDVSRALKAQNQCRIALRLLLALRAAERSRKSRNRTNRLLKQENRHHDQALGQTPPEAHSCPAKGPPQNVGLVDGTPRPAGGADPRLKAMEEVDRSANGCGQGPLRPECARARLQKPCLYRNEAGGTAASPRLRPHNRPRQGAPPHRLCARHAARSAMYQRMLTHG